MTVLVASTSQEDARKACEEGVIWRAQLLDCELYWAPLNPVQCFKCWKWGHTQHYCKSTPLCPRCGTKAHGEGGREGENQCPTHNNEIPVRCLVCGRRHPAWSKECPEKSKVLSKAKEAYQFRPRIYEAALPRSPSTEVTIAPASFNFSGSGGKEEETYQVVGRKRMRGRPTNAAAAQQQALRDPQQTRIIFATAGTQLADAVAPGPTTEQIPVASSVTADAPISAPVENDIVSDRIHCR